MAPWAQFYSELQRKLLIFKEARGPRVGHDTLTVRRNRSGPLWGPHDNEHPVETQCQHHRLESKSRPMDLDSPENAPS